MTSPGQKNPHPGRIDMLPGGRTSVEGNVGMKEVVPGQIWEPVYVRSTYYDVMSGGGKVFLIPHGHI